MSDVAHMLRAPLSAAAVLLAALHWAAPATAQTPEILNIPSLTLSEEQFLAGDASAAAPLTLTGRLRLPGPDGRVPAMILLHGSDGPGSGAVWTWQEYLPTLGIATLSLDSYTARGLEQISTDQQLFGQFTQVYDAYRAVEALAAHPRIDPDRIAVMGFSRGGTAALYSALTRFQNAFGPATARIAAHLPFYPACNLELVGELEIATAPIREFHGTADDWTPIEPCRAYIDRLAAAGYDVVMHEFPGALHAFDSATGPALNVHLDAQTSRNCRRVEAAGRLLNSDTGQPFSYTDACVEYGPSNQFSSAATREARTAVKAFLIELYDLP